MNAASAGSTPAAIPLSPGSVVGTASPAPDPAPLINNSAKTATIRVIATLSTSSTT